MSTSTFVRRAVAAVAGGAVVAGGLLAVAPAPVAHAAASTAPADLSAAWLVDRLDDQHLFTYENYGSSSTDVGLSIDLMLDLIERGTDATVVSQIASAVETKASTYAAHDSYPTTFDCAYPYGPVSSTTVDTYYANATAKALAGLKAAGRSGATVDGLEAQLETITIDSGADAGRISDTTTQGGVSRPDCDYANVFGQAFAVRALDAVGSPEEDAALTYLLGQQNGDGSWNQDLRLVGGTQPAPDPAADATAIAILQLQQIQPSSGLQAPTTAAIAKGIAWLVANQASDGSFGATGLFGPNANETGLAGWALGKAGKADAAARAAGWLAAHQALRLAGCASGLDAENGAVAYSDNALATGLASGITATAEGQWIRSTAAALPALAYLPSSSPSLTTFVDAGTTAQLPIQGTYPGQQVCVSGLGASQRVTSPALAKLTVPAGTADHTVTLTYAGGSATATLKALDAKKLKVKVAAKLKANKKATIKVKGLAAGESVTVKIGKKKVTGTANAKGVAKVKIKAKKKGKAAVKVVGQFPDRKGKATTRVV
ncbi:hypothetical protein [Nocardioides nitrophenolicus]|uniref:hypothetical protein n=1 Tax=Nocardioides nitrophenolicus TaxID=60489 RepID=UPI001957299A|nr:hypothetical protein [Nocardioides nitrophenolicus]MBM7519420.1 hypothetical protein [Nocardioides nitrophenolicus]